MMTLPDGTSSRVRWLVPARERDLRARRVTAKEGAELRDVERSKASTYPASMARSASFTVRRGEATSVFAARVAPWLS
jgi:hypothetical protein